jgi:hypothetical protein
MKFVLVNGRTPHPKSSCSMCREQIGETYLRELSTRLFYCGHDCYREHCQATLSILDGALGNATSRFTTLRSEKNARAIMMSLRDTATKSRLRQLNLRLVEQPLNQNYSAERDSTAVFLSQFVILQGIGLAFIAALWVAGAAEKPFESAAAPMCYVILSMGAIGVICALLRRWEDVAWIAKHVVRIGLLGTVIGLGRLTFTLLWILFGRRHFHDAPFARWDLRRPAQSLPPSRAGWSLQITTPDHPLPECGRASSSTDCSPSCRWSACSPILILLPSWRQLLESKMSRRSGLVNAPASECSIQRTRMILALLLWFGAASARPVMARRIIRTGRMLHSGSGQFQKPLAGTNRVQEPRYETAPHRLGSLAAKEVHHG